MLMRYMHLRAEDLVGIWWGFSDHGYEISRVRAHEKYESEIPIVTIEKSNFPSDLGISSMSNADALVMSVLTRECPHYMPPTPSRGFSQLIRTRNLNLPFVPPNKELGECQPDYDNDRIRIERNSLHGDMEYGPHNHGFTARS